MPSPLIVVMPVFNEAGCIREVCLEWLHALRQVPGSRLLVVDDGSCDETPAILRGLEGEHPPLKVLHQANRGHGPAIWRGYQAAIRMGCEWVFQVDSDGQFRVPDWCKLWECRGRSDFVLGARAGRRDSLLRRLLSLVHRTLVLLIFRVRISDPNVPFRLIRTSLLSELLEMVPQKTFAPNVFLSILARKFGHDTCDVPVVHLPRRAGTGSIRMRRLALIAFRCLREMLVLRRALAQKRTVASAKCDAGRQQTATHDLLIEQLRTRPLFAALLRGVECQILRQIEPLPEPLLDLGCGDGGFASIAVGGSVFTGLDPDPGGLRQAARTARFHSLVCGSATRLPFTDACFAAILANSVLEHIPDVESALRECHRVLRPGGVLIVTVPSHCFAEMLGGSWLLRRAGVPGLATAYGRWFNWHSRHFHTDSERTWKERLSRHGFEIKRCEYYLTADALRAFDLAHYLSVPRLISRKLIGKWVAFPRLTLNPLWERWLRPHYTHFRPRDVGPYLFLQALKPPMQPTVGILAPAVANCQKAAGSG